MSIFDNFSNNSSRPQSGTGGSTSPTAATIKIVALGKDSRLVEYPAGTRVSDIVRTEGLANNASFRLTNLLDAGGGSTEISANATIGAGNWELQVTPRMAGAA